jgi:hypothetical protein
MSRDDPHEALGELIDRGLSASEAGRALGISRNAAMARAHRQGWRFGMSRAAALSLQHQPKADASMNAVADLAPPDEDLAPLDALAAELLTAHRLTPRALPLMVERVMADDALRHACFARLVEAECRRALEARMAQRRQEARRLGGGGPVGSARSSDITGLAGAVASSLLDDVRLPNGRKLGDATREDLATAMAAYQIQADDAAVKHRWLRLIQQSVPPGKTVRQVLSDERLAELKAEARKTDQ